MNVGFTGTRRSMSLAQVGAVRRVLASLARESGESLTAHHGDCVGADAQVETICNIDGYHTTAHPPSDQKLRAGCHSDTVLPPKPYLARNRDIVEASSVLIAAPYEKAEPPRTRGGTWYTVAYGRVMGRRIFICWPDGSVSEEAGRA